MSELPVVHQFPTSDRCVVLRASFLAICDYNYCAAKLLQNFHYWHQVRLDTIKEKYAKESLACDSRRPTPLHVFKTYDDLARDILGDMRTSSFAAALKLLHEKGFVESSFGVGAKTDRTKFYLYKADAVQTAMNSLRDGYIDAIVATIPASSGKKTDPTISSDSDTESGSPTISSDLSDETVGCVPTISSHLYKEAENTTENTETETTCSAQPARVAEPKEEPLDFDLQTKGFKGFCSEEKGEDGSNPEVDVKFVGSPIPPTPLPQLDLDSQDSDVVAATLADFKREWGKIRRAPKLSPSLRRDIEDCLSAHPVPVSELEDCLASFAGDDDMAGKGYPVRVAIAWLKKRSSGGWSRRPAQTASMQPASCKRDLAAIWNKNAPTAIPARGIYEYTQELEDRLPEICARVEAKIRDNADERKYLTLPWLLKTKDQFEEPNWVRFLHGDFDFVPSEKKPSKKAVCDDAIAAVLKDLEKECNVA